MRKTLIITYIIRRTRRGRFCEPFPYLFVWFLCADRYKKSRSCTPMSLSLLGMTHHLMIITLHLIEAEPGICYSQRRLCGDRLVAHLPLSTCTLAKLRPASRASQYHSNRWSAVVIVVSCGNQGMAQTANRHAHRQPRHTHTPRMIIGALTGSPSTMGVIRNWAVTPCAR